MHSIDCSQAAEASTRLLEQQQILMLVHELTQKQTSNTLVSDLWKAVPVAILVSSLMSMVA